MGQGHLQVGDGKKGFRAHESEGFWLKAVGFGWASVSVLVESLQARFKKVCLCIYPCMTNAPNRVANNKHVPFDLAAPQI